MDADLRVCTFNVRRDRGDDGADNWEHRRELFFETLREIDADVIGLQEPLPHQYDEIRDRFDAFEWYGVPRQGNKDGELVPVGWRADRFDARSCETRWLSETPMRSSMSWNGNWPRPATEVRLLDWTRGGTEISVWNTHFDTGETRRRVESGHLMNGWVAGNAPCVVVGDFNAEIGSEPIEALIGDTSLRDGRALAEETVGPVPTSHGWDGTHHDCIDHVFVTPDVDVSRFETVAKSRDGRYPSDHFPVVADLLIDA